MPFALSLWVHVLVGVLGIGPVTAMPLLARSLRRAPSDETAAVLGRLILVFNLALAATLATGIAMALLVGPAIERTVWFRASTALALVLGALAGMMRGALRKKAAPRVEQLAWGMLATVGVVVVLMMTRP